MVFGLLFLFHMNWTQKFSWGILKRKLRNSGAGGEKSSVTSLNAAIVSDYSYIFNNKNITKEKNPVLLSIIARILKTL